MAKSKNTADTKRDIYQEVTDRIIGYLEQGMAPWRNPIRRNTGDGWPKNLDTGKRYRGINVFLLGMRSWEAGFSSDYWMTFKQAQKCGGQVRKGEKGSLVTFWKMYATRDRETGRDIEVPVLKHYTAFNAEQIDGIDSPDAPKTDSSVTPHEPLVEAERIVDGYRLKPSIFHHDGGRAFYQPTSDKVCIPKPERFDSRESYYSTLFHELSHSTGHSSRLDRGLDTMLPDFGSPDYSREELVAEMSAAFLCAASGISPLTIEQSAAYLQSWINVLKGDKRLVIGAAGASQKSADLILGTATEDKAKPSTTANVSAESTIETSDRVPMTEAKSKPSQLDLF